jgi:fumarate reductase subunit D
MTMPLERPRNAAYRRDGLWIAAQVHRVSGVLLACFLPLHFLVLGLALEGSVRLDGFLRFTDLPGVKLAEAGLVFLLAVHLIGGIRVLLIENLAWRGRHKTLATVAVATAAALAALFLLRVF